MTKTQTAFKMDLPELQKAKYVAWHERTTLTVMITDDLLKRIAKFEKDNGPITAAQIQKMEASK